MRNVIPDNCNSISVPEGSVLLKIENWIRCADWSTLSFNSDTLSNSISGRDGKSVLSMRFESSNSVSLIVEWAVDEIVINTSVQAVTLKNFDNLSREGFAPIINTNFLLSDLISNNGRSIIVIWLYPAKTDRAP